MRNSNGGRDNRKSNRDQYRKPDYAGEMLFDDEEDYDDDADYDVVDDMKAHNDDYSDSAFGPDADNYDTDDDAWHDDVAAADDDPSDEDGYYDEEYDDTEDWQDMKDSKRKKKNRVWGIILALEIVAAIVIGVLFVKSYINNTYSKMQYNELKNTHINEDLNEESVKKMTGYTNIALFGIDTRDSGMVDDGVRSDSIIICSINNDTQEVKLLSLYRDTYLELCNDSQSYEKAAHAYA